MYFCRRGDRRRRQGAEHGKSVRAVESQPGLFFLEKKKARYIRAIAKLGFEGSATELLEILTARDDDGALKAGAVPDNLMRRKFFPKQPNHLSGRLRLMAPGLRQEGITIENSHTNQGSHIVIRETEKTVG